MEAKWHSGQMRTSLLQDLPRTATTQSGTAAAQGAGTQTPQNTAAYVMGPTRGAVRSGSGKNASGEDPMLDGINELLDLGGGVNEDLLKNDRVGASIGLGQNTLGFINSGTGISDAITEHRYGDAALHGLDLGTNTLSTMDNLGKLVPHMSFMPDGLTNGILGGKGTIESLIAMKDGNAMDKTLSFLDVGVNGLSTYEGLQKLMPNKLPGVPNGVTDVAGGGKKLIGAVREAIRGGAQKRSMNSVANRLLAGGERSALDDDKLLKHDISMQGKRQGQIMVAGGAGQALEGAFQASAGAAQLSGVGAVATPVLKGLAYTTNVSTKIATTALHNKMKSEVTEQTTGINDRLIDEFLNNQGLGLNAKRRREAKRSMMRYLGYKTGYREELLADQTTKRARKIAAGVKQGDADYLEIARGLGAKRGKEANYDAASIQARLGGTKTRNQVIAGSLRAKAMASGNVARRSRRHAAAVQKVDTLQDLSRSINHVMFSPNSHPTKKDQKAKAWVEKRLKKAQRYLDKRIAHNQKRDAARDAKIERARVRQAAERARARATSP